MDWVVVLIVVGVVASVLMLKQFGQVSKAKAVDYLKHGARILAVRSPSEFQSKHLPNALHIPLGGLEQHIGQAAPSKNETLLLHCASGGRSALGTRILKRMGYTSVFNLGSYGRAESILRESQT